MDKQMYLKHFSRAARWQLGGPEAVEVVADYAELLDQRPPDRDDTLVEDLGRPGAAARLLTEPKSYRRWLWVFAILADCLLLSEVLVLGAQHMYNRYLLVGYGPFVVGLVLALVWFRPQFHGQKMPLPRGVLWALAGLAVCCITAGAMLAGLFTGAWDGPLDSYGPTARWILCVSSTVATAAGLFGAVRARMNDRRWSALYVLGLSMVVLCLQILAALYSLDGLSLDAQGWLTHYFVRWAVVGGIGLVGTGVALC
ncbi:hypothetical protein ACTQ33_10270 [Candidatus Avoscillospira sp. LCP25S3_F1]|uniref:hypothetical protein n=1 Tax=Candidatus Avoscillospira sp. LCP25S3_F1 TaxID=3438825 RepID=UPI003F936854